ncbi:Wzz/FepE/Etk N-terminal domain-containing protein [Paeniglutamicibacter sp. Y32M11]|uniref:Wzz/FepE/Etk N-terminal domain-containing protein n=1 Tax=Paeniglutamicibacter sp. Y32M11 TaxID=2853258 RepID=UPI00351CD4D4
MANGGRSDFLRVNDLFRQLRRRWRTLLVTVAATVALSAAGAQLIPAEYSAVATLTVSPITTSPFSSAAVNQQINITTERAILGSSQVATLAIKTLGHDIGPEDLMRHTEVAAPQGSQILEVTVSADTPEKAAARANALASAYLISRADGAKEIADAFIADLDGQIKEIENKANADSQERQQLWDLRAQRTTLKLVALAPGQVIGLAIPPTEKSSLDAKIFLVGGLVGGGLLGLALSLLRDRWDRKVRFADRLVAATGATVYTLNQDDEEESLRWILRFLTRSYEPNQRPGRPAGFLGLMPADPSVLVLKLRDMAQAHGLDSCTVDKDVLNGQALDAGWPLEIDRIELGSRDLVLMELAEFVAGSRLASISERFLESLVLVVHHKTNIKDVIAVVGQARDLPHMRLIVVFYDGRPRRRATDTPQTTTTPSGTEPQNLKDPSPFESKVSQQDMSVNNPLKSIERKLDAGQRLIAGRKET